MSGRKKGRKGGRKRKIKKGVEKQEEGSEEKEPWPQAYLFPITSNYKGKNIKSLPYTHNHNDILNFLQDMGILLCLHLTSINNFWLFMLQDLIISLVFLQTH